jgi:hypothetical protein
MKPKKLKEAICNALNGRRKQEKAIIGLFFQEKNGRFYPGKFKNMYNIIIKNLSKMNDEHLNDVYNNIVDTKNGLTQSIVGSAVHYIKKTHKDTKNTKNGK